MIFLLFNTLKDVGFIRIQKRIRFEIRKRFDSLIPSKISLIISCPVKRPELSDKFSYLNSEFPYIRDCEFIPKSIEFDFLNKKEILNTPISWNSKSRSKLWQFNLHYFEKIRNLLDESIKKQEWQNEIYSLSYLIDDWIRNNIPGNGDGWSSYTISLRCRNLIYLYRICPSICNKERLDSLWNQLFWLSNHLEDCYGGNHYLENLITLVIGFIQFEGITARNIFKSSLIKLEEELEEQILKDGGHFERSAAYHLLILQRLCEVGFVLQGATNKRPIWLVNKIKKMTNWSELIKLKNGNIPNFNDSPRDISLPIYEVIKIAKSYINNHKLNQKSVIGELSKVSSNIESSTEKHLLKNKFSKIIDLEYTGWTIIKLGDGYELIFQSGDSSPKYLPGHSHSDLLSFDLFFKGRPIFVEAGTSIYKNSIERKYERSGKSHNVLQVAPFFERRDESFSNWIEPVEVWGSFRVAKKAKIIKRFSRAISNNEFELKGSHDGFKKIGCLHERIINLKINNEGKMIFNLRDRLQLDKKIKWRQWWHLGPEVGTEIKDRLIKAYMQNYQIPPELNQTWYSPRFGVRIPRKSISFEGFFPPGNHEINISLEF